MINTIRNWLSGLSGALSAVRAGIVAVLALAAAFFRWRAKQAEDKAERERQRADQAEARLEQRRQAGKANRKGEKRTREVREQARSQAQDGERDHFEEGLR